MATIHRYFCKSKSFFLNLGIIKNKQFGPCFFSIYVWLVLWLWDYARTVFTVHSNLLHITVPYFKMLHLPCLSPATPLSTVRYIYTTLFLSVALIYIVCAIHICFIQLRQTYIYFFVYIYLHVTLIGFYWYIFKVCFRIQLFYLLDYFVDYIHVFYLFHMFCLFCLLIHIMFSYLLSYFLRL